MAGKVAVVTGGARGIGKVISARLAAEGASVAMFGRNGAAGAAAVEEVGAAGGTAVFCAVDIGDDASVQGAVEQVQAELGNVTCLVNNAANTDLFDGPVGALDPAVWQEVLKVDLGGVFSTCRHVLPGMVEAGGGSIITIGTTVATLGQRGLAARTAAKSAAAGLMRSIAIDYGPSLVRANTVVLGLVPHDQYSFLDDGELGDAFRSVHALPFLGSPSDAADAVLFLASDESRWITGTEVVVSGGASRVPDVMELVLSKLESGQGE
jgi:NAD(P)-dependent dehydrogenase (short-subunit alcohol dehydrogenase family)